MKLAPINFLAILIFTIKYGSFWYKMKYIMIKSPVDMYEILYTNFQCNKYLYNTLYLYTTQS